MSNTRSMMDFLKKGFKQIGAYTCAPTKWACGGYDKSPSFSQTWGSGSNSDTNNIVGGMMGGALDLSCNLCKCCTRSPCCCLGSLVTVTTGAGAALLWGVFGALGTTAAAITDIPEAACGKAPQSQSMR